MALDFTVLTKDTNGAPELVCQASSGDEAIELIREFHQFGIADAAARIGSRTFERHIEAAIIELHAQYNRSRIGDTLKTAVTFGGVTLWIQAR